MSVLLPNGRAWLVANWVSFGLFRDALRWLRDGSRLADDIRFCVDAGVDTLDVQGAHDATLVELSEIVEHVIESNRAAGPAAFHDPTAYPVYMEKLDELATAIAGVVRPLYCKVYVDSPLERHDLQKQLCTALGGSLARWTVVAPAVEIDVRTNDEYRTDVRGRDRFLYFRYLLDIVATGSARRADVVEAVAQALKALWASDARAVASCDFEDELPRRGGIAMSDGTVDDYILVPHDQIDFLALPEATLLGLAVQQFEPFIATTALGELGIRRAPELRIAALQILSAPWDRYLTASALTCLFGADFEAGMVAMERLLPDCRDAEILGAMIDNVLCETERIARAGYAGFCRALARRVCELDPAEFDDQRKRDDFLAAFGPR